MVIWRFDNSHRHLYFMGSYFTGRDTLALMR